MRVTTLVDNLTYISNLQAEHGLCFHFNLGSTKVLLDVGQTSAFLHNANMLGIDIADVDVLILSHSHYDHCGGLEAFLEVNGKAKIYTKPSFFRPKYDVEGRYLGYPFDFEEVVSRFTPISSVIDIEGLKIVPEIPIVNSWDTHFEGFKVETDNDLLDDCFDDELFVCYPTAEELSIFTSCSHRGISNIVQAATKLFPAPAISITGGFHLKDAPAEQVDATIAYLKTLSLNKLGVCHCTGVGSFAQMAGSLTGKVYYCSAGSKYDF
jgi:7,8-dihydropterin-6-yl-methyl-4-(beta-D-ribofuranosyl)aminobenzene 5'-phosphate synthase